MYNLEDLYKAIAIYQDVELLRKITEENPKLLHEKDKFGFSSIHYAADGEEEEILQLLLDNGVDVNDKNDDGNTPLHCLAANGEESEEIITILLENGADKTIINNNVETALDIAKAREDIDNINLLK
ncbi:ankyrin repeat domain-containing protein [Clostridium sp. MSJ-11]|uniref:Ankyrin repeat domain-containing protein n=1 Tax=Clostridium mobile TaxID=2841512 RepID=A0ABS6EEY2_9CLOT|nr:ankyrin repeat domain-containing protein [Clostridium mobile]MBU5483749.1 ankyrin repeat domain-containing protein [Clostridium mobile]